MFVWLLPSNKETIVGSHAAVLENLTITVYTVQISHACVPAAFDHNTVYTLPISHAGVLAHLTITLSTLYQFPTLVYWHI